MPAFLANIPGMLMSLVTNIIAPIAKAIKYFVLYKLVSGHIKGKVAEKFNDIRERQLKIKSQVRKSRNDLIDRMSGKSGF